jgi:hypothetical protein
LQPTTVTLVDPDTAALKINVLLGAAASIVNDAVKLFICQPVVSTVWSCGQMPLAIFTTTAVSDRQTVRTDCVPPTRTLLQ